jgi:hypothetical protein
VKEKDGRGKMGAKEKRRLIANSKEDCGLKIERESGIL